MTSATRTPSPGWVAELSLTRQTSLPAWLPHVHSRATFAQSTERRFRRWLNSSATDPISSYGPLVTRALRDRGERLLALDTSVLSEKVWLIRVPVLFRGRAVSLVSRVLGHPSAQASTAPHFGRG